MPCLTSGTLTICTPFVTEVQRRIVYCPKCKRRTRHAVRCHEWYASDRVCLACGALNGQGHGDPRHYDTQVTVARVKARALEDWRRAAAVLRGER